MTKTTCPCCGAQLNIVPADQATSYQTAGLVGRLFARKGQTYEHSVESPWVKAEPARPVEPSAPLPATGGSRTVTTWRPREVASDVTTPAIWSVVGGAMIGLTSIPFAVAGHWSAVWPIGIWLGSTTIGFFAASWRILIDKSLIAHEDDLKIAPPAPALVSVPAPVAASRTMRVEVVDRDGQRSQFADLPDTAAFHRFARLLTQPLPGKTAPESFTEATAKLAELIIDAGDTTKDPPNMWGFRQIREIFIDRGWGNWKNPQRHNLGFALTVAGKALLRQIAETTPPPQEDSYAN